MTPEPTPSCSRSGAASTAAAVVILTTAGPALAATSTTADDSSMEIGWRTVAVSAFAAGGGVVLSRAPEAVSAAKVPPEARTADSSAIPRTVPGPVLPRRRSVTVATGCRGADSNQRSGVVGAGAGSVQRALVQSFRGAGGGVNEADGSDCGGWLVDQAGVVCGCV